MTLIRRRRETTALSEITAGCFVCGDDLASWTGEYAQANAARHHDKTGHSTWAIINRTIRYGAPPELPDAKPAPSTTNEGRV